MKSNVSTEILCVSDAPEDARLIREVLEDHLVTNHVSILHDGADVLPYLRHEGKYEMSRHPNLIILDLSTPGSNGKEVLAELKSHPVIKRIPAVVLSSSDAEQDIVDAYESRANCYITKPGNPGRFVETVQLIFDFWLTIVKLPDGR